VIFWIGINTVLRYARTVFIEPKAMTVIARSEATKQSR